MKGLLASRLSRAKQHLTKVHAALDQSVGILPTPIEDAMRAFCSRSREIPHWLDLLEARSAARTSLAGLEGTADPGGRVTYGGTKGHYAHVRLLHLQAYITTNWALADSVCRAAGEVLCTESALKNERSPPQLISQFVSKTQGSKTTANLVFPSIRTTYGWPASVSYALRNCLVHDGGRTSADALFAGAQPESAFQVSATGWRGIVTCAEKCGADPSNCRDTMDISPTVVPADLRRVLDACEREVDAALGVLMSCACHFALIHVGLMLGDDARLNESSDP